MRRNHIHWLDGVHRRCVSIVGVVEMPEPHPENAGLGFRWAVHVIEGGETRNNARREMYETQAENGQ